ncbi:hypothetical protein ASPZODRAFT_1231231 [Penicilliopsis zonata CBS 506.65]|uniref:Major facilitator superfamily (MFS) profile domain-containing protein n=1 Tax=Penicilliopsis zonata CBS 506.65 TaxID=1073090 RepID=A0A1L9S7M4_9EURO|nr:hypothetical protein ASPZODRAFT_1231231 [Penicilliopsis zonata CBS 506.65]OJJ43177.1 hypothetical protein ASPZODRAFT_1231231 [Penicilliopsis zonata CBS 506.65]
MLTTLRKSLADANPRLFLVCAYASLGSVSQGFDSAWWGSILGATAFNNHFGSVKSVASDGTVSYSLSTTEISLGTGLGMAFGMIGGLSVSWPMKYWGRKACLWIIASILLSGIIIEAVATIPASYACLIVGKALVSIGTGLSAGSICAYLAECAPPSMRGVLVTLYINIQSVGSLVGEIVVYCVVNRSDAGNWLFPICTQAIFPLLFLAGIYWLPESPRWLVAQGRLDEAEEVVRSLRPWAEERVHQEVIEMAFAHEEEQRLDAQFGWVDLFKGSNRVRTLVAIGTQTLQQAQGLTYIISYLVLTLEDLGFTNGQLINFLMYIIQFVCTGTSFITAEKIGRRNVLMGGAFVQGCCMMVISGIVTHDATPTGRLGDVTLAMYLIWMVSMACSWMPMAYILGSEVPAQGLRDKTLSVSIWWGYGVGLLIIMGSPYMTDAGYGGLGAKVGLPFSVVGCVLSSLQINYIWSIVSFGTCAWVYFLAPELKGRSLEEIDYMFEEGVPIRQFGTWDTSAMLEDKRQRAVETIEKVAVAHVESL